ncbi:MAG: hypothetical protein Q7J84_10525 [Sulfuricaulis sp.]|nr:hypothetical protein [Sulfuricaulis sp.]
MIETYKGLTIRLEYDQDCESPLECDEGVHITYRKDARYVLGNTPEDSDQHAETAARIESGDLIGFAVYAYIHSGVVLSAAPFSCPWDSGQSGFIYVDRATALEWHGGKILTAKKRAATINSLHGVLQSYSDWQSGECYRYVIEDPAGEKLDSCCGFIGYDYALQEARGQADGCIKHMAREAKARTASARAGFAAAQQRRQVMA